MDVKGEVISIREALKRVGLESLATESHDREFIEWDGYPIPFAVGHTAVKGFGPLDNEANNDVNGKGRRYQQIVRISQHHCDGRVLFCWGGILFSGAKRTAYRASWGLNIVIDETPDGKDTCLKVAISC